MGHPRAHPLVVLSRAFFARFFASETVTSEMQLRQTLAWVLGFLLTPGFILLMELFPAYQSIVIRAARFHTRGIVDDWLEWIVLVFVTYSMVTVGLIAAFVWDTLNFDQRDAMVLGPLPLGARTIVGGKLIALGALLALAAVPINGINAFFFAMETADLAGFATFVSHFAAFFAATVLGAVFVFAAMVALRGTVALVAGPRLAAIAGSLLQFVFVVALLTCVVLSPAVWRIPSAVVNNPDTIGWLPTSWFLGLFERMRGSGRVYFVPLAARAVAAVPIALGAAVLVSIFSFGRLMQRAVSQPHGAGWLGRRVVRPIARRVAGRDPIAKATADFVLLTIARNRAQHTPIAMNLAVGVAVALAALTRSKTLDGLMHPRTIVLWIPLLVSYWMTIGVRAAAFVPSELPASWTFNAVGTVHARAVWSGTRAAALSIVVPPALGAVWVIVAPLLGWRLAAWHTALVFLVSLALVDATMLTIRGLPFTHPYHPGHARLRTRWPLYLIGMFVVAMWPVKAELRSLGGGEFRLLLAATAVATAIHMASLCLTVRRPAAEAEIDADGDEMAVLSLGSGLPDAHSGA